jgi:stage V sporulation protein SpoVS
MRFAHRQFAIVKAAGVREQLDKFAIDKVGGGALDVMQLGVAAGEGHAAAIDVVSPPGFTESGVEFGERARVKTRPNKVHHGFAM